MNQKKAKKVISLIATIALLFGSFSAAFAEETDVSSAAAQYGDIKGHWAETAINHAVVNGLLTGYDTGEMKPEANLTRGQMATVMAKAFGAAEQASLSQFTDMDPDAWYYESMAKAVQMKIFKGYNNLLRPNDNITREEVFSVLSTAFKCSGAADTLLDKFTDKDQISQWAKDGVASLVTEGYIAGSNGKLNPKNYISRAEFAQIMFNLLKNYINQEGTYTADFNGNTVINQAGVTLKNLKVAGNLTIGDGVGDGDVTLDNVEITGKMIVRGGGENSIKIIGNSNIKNIIVARVDGQVRIYSADGAEVGQVIVDGSDDVIIEGDVGTVTVLADHITVKATNAVIDTATIDGEESKIIVGTGSTVNTMTVSAQNVNIEVTGQVTSIVTKPEADGANVSGTGKVGTVQANSDNVVVTTIGAKVTAGSEATGVVAGTETVSGDKTVTVTTDTGGRGGGGGSSAIAITSIGAISGTAKVGVELTAGTVSPSGAAVTYQWTVCSTAGGAYTNISGATSNKYTPTAGDVGKYIKVSATGSGGYSGTVTSDATAAVLPTAIATAAISGVTVPATGGTPTAIMADTSEYTATISWSGNPVTFAEAVTYTAIITLTPKTGYTLAGVPQNYFTVAGATASNSASSGVVTAVFPKTASLPVSGITAADVAVTQGSVIFQYSFTAASGAVTYSEALSSPYYLNADESTVLLTNGSDSTVAVSVGALGIDTDNKVSYDNLADVQAEFTGLNFVPTQVKIHLVGATNVNRGADEWSIDATVNLDASEILLLKMPAVANYSPSDNGANVALNANLVLTFDQNVTAVGGKNITIFKTADDSVFEIIEATDPAITVSGNTVTVNPAGTFTNSTGYYVNINTGAFGNATTGNFLGIGDKTTWNFTAVAAPPAVSSFGPADNAAGVAVDADLVVTFDQNVTAVSGKNITIYNAADDSVLETIDATDAKITVAGSTVTVNPSQTLTYGADYYVTVDAGAFTNAVTGDYAGITNTTAWNFTAVVLAPAITGHTVATGSVEGATKITYAPGAGNSLRVVKQAGAFTVPTVGLNASAIGSAYTSGSNITGAAATEHIGLYEVNGSDLVVKFVDITLASEDIAVNAPAITGYIVARGSVAGATKITYTPDAGNSLRAIKQAGAFTVPVAGLNASAIGSAYISGSNITGAAATEHIGLYEVNGSNLVVKFVDITLASEDIATNAPAITGHTVAKGSAETATMITYTPGAGNSLRVVKQAGAFTVPLVGIDASGIGSAYTSGDDILGAVTGEHVGLYEVDGSDQVVKFIDITLAVTQIKDTTAPVVGTVTDANYNWSNRTLTIATSGSSAINDIVDISKIIIITTGPIHNSFTQIDGTWCYSLTAGTTGKVTGNNEITLYLNGTDNTAIGGTALNKNGFKISTGMLYDLSENVSTDAAQTVSNIF